MSSPVVDNRGQEITVGATVHVLGRTTYVQQVVVTRFCETPTGDVLVWLQQIPSKVEFAEKPELLVVLTEQTARTEAT